MRELAAATGESVTAAVRRAAAERLQRLCRGGIARSLAGEWMAIGARCAALPDIDTRSAEDFRKLVADEQTKPQTVALQI